MTRRLGALAVGVMVVAGVSTAWGQADWTDAASMAGVVPLEQTLGPMIEDGTDEGTPVQVFLRAAGSNFTPRDGTTEYSYSGGGCMQRTSAAGDGWFTWDVQVPDGAVIDFLRVYFYDNDATYDINSELWAFDGAGGTVLIAEADSSGTLGYSSAGSDFFSHQVSTTDESLVVVASIQGGGGSNLRLCGVRLRYQTP